jgi:hypothetical protein
MNPRFKKQIQIRLLLCCIIWFPAVVLEAQPETVIPSEAFIAPFSVNGYDRSTVFKGIRLSLGSHRKEALGSDIWPITWADDGHQYTGFGDGAGFGVASYKEQGGPNRVSLGISRIEGDPDDYRGVNVWGGKNTENPAQFGGKPTGLICIEGVLYMFWGGPASTTIQETRLAVSYDHSKTWTLMDWKWTMQDKLFAGTFINFGKDNADARDDFVYAFFSRLSEVPEEKRSWIYEVPGQIDLARVRKNQLLKKESWEWYAGLDTRGNPLWSNDLNKREPVFEDPSGIKIVSGIHHKASGRFLLSYSHTYTDGNFGLFEAANPWGPWRVVAYEKNVEVFMPPEPTWRVCTFQFAPKWWRNKGREFTLVFNVGDDAWNTVDGELLY